MGSAAVFAALGDKTRIRLVSRLCHEGPLSISRLTAGAKVTRQAVSKHLRLMERSGLVCSARVGRERHWQLNQRRLADARLQLEQISMQWDAALERLRAYIEN
jgi:DNA-binding transcriptional ArsR family regulator